MARFGGQKTILDPRKPFSVEERGHITDLRNNLRLYLDYDPTTPNVFDAISGVPMQNSIPNVEANAVPQFYGSPNSWKLKTTGPSPAFIPRGGSVNHARDASTVSFWFKNNSATQSALNVDHPVFTVTNNAATSTTPSLPTKFTIFSVSDMIAGSSTGEEFTFGWNIPAGGSFFPQWYLCTRKTNVNENKQVGYPGDLPFGGAAPNANSAFVTEIRPNVLPYSTWHHIVICTSKGNSNNRTGGQDPKGYTGYSAVYVNGSLVGRYLGFSEPGTVIKPYGSSPVERYGFQQWDQIAPVENDKLWFPYDSMLGNRDFYQFCAWDRILNEDEVRSIYLGTVGGVYTETVTSYSAPPRKQKLTAVRTVKNVNIGFPDSQGIVSQPAFDDRRSITGNVLSSRGSNYPLDTAKTPFPFKTENLVTIDDSAVLSASIVLREVDEVSDNFTASPYVENIVKSDMTLLDGTQARAAFRIGIPSQLSSISQQVAGRTDSNFAQTVSKIPPGSFSLYMSSVFKDSPSSFTHLSDPNSTPTGIAGTGFLYYSPVYKTWIEKRPYGQWLSIAADHRKSHEYSDAVNSVTYNTKDYPHPPPAHPDATDFVNFDAGLPDKTTKRPWIVARNSYNTSSISRLDAGWFWSGSISSEAIITGTNETLAQFTASPQLGYFLPFKEHLERAGYPTIGSPTVVFGAPFSPRYHGYDHETIKLSNYIDRPFKLKKVILRLPVSIVRKNEVAATPMGGPLGDPEWTKNVPSRRDIDNYVFFLYRQRRQTRQITDGVYDISSSMRCLIASGSLCVYNSSTFGRAYQDGFSSVFGTDTDIVTEPAPGYFVTQSLNSMYDKCNTDGVDPITGESLTPCSSPLHGPAYSIDAGLNDFSDGVHAFVTNRRVEIEMHPAVVMGGVLNNTLTYMTSTTADHYSSSLFYSEFRDAFYNLHYSFNRLFNRYPYTGSYTNPNDGTRHCPITTGVQNIWLGGTRQPEFVNNAANGDVSVRDASAVLEYRPYYAYSSGTSNDTYRNSFFTGYYRKKHNEPTFDIEVGRCGLSLTSHGISPFAQRLQITNDSRTIHAAFSKDNREDLPTVFQRTNLIRYEIESPDEGGPYSPSYLNEYQSSIGNLSGSNMADLVSSLTVGNTVASSNSNRQLLRDYILLPTDEIILGLDAGVTPPPDVAPLTGEPYPDKLNP